MITGIDIPLEAAVAASAAAFALGALAHRRQVERRQARTDNPLSGLFARDALKRAVMLANRRAVPPSSGQAVLQARIDQMAALDNGCDPATRDEVLGNIAAVMKAGIRREDRCEPLAGEGFTITMAGPDEHAAKGVAERLRRAIGRLNLPHVGGEGLFTASFGVATGAAGESGARLVAQARAALDAARRTGSDHVIAASEIEEVLLLPAPAASPTEAA